MRANRRVGTPDVHRNRIATTMRSPRVSRVTPKGVSSLYEGEAGVETLNATLSQRVRDLIESQHRSPLLSTTGTRAAVEELMDRNERLELAVRELAAEVEQLAAMLVRA